MNSRERTLVLLLGSMLAIAAGAGFYFLGMAPYFEKKKALDEAIDAAGKKQEELDGVLNFNKKLKPLQQQSLPKDADSANRDYNLMLMKMLRDSGARGHTVNFNEAQSKNPIGIPLIDSTKKQSYAYRKLIYTIKIPKTDLPTLTEFLRRYYGIPLLHQITKLEIKRTNVDLASDSRGIKDRTDLEVTVITEALLVDGAPERKSVVPVSPAFAGVLGFAGHATMESSVKVGQTITPAPLEQVLASGNRDYYRLAAKDFFHGTLPEIKPKPPAPPIEDEKPLPPKPDYSPYIKYGSVIRTFDGFEQIVELSVFDLINHEDYEITLSSSGKAMKTVVKKFYYNGPKKRMGDRGEKLDIENASMRTKHSFAILGVDGDALILSERPPGLAAEKSADKPKAKGSKPPRLVMPSPDPRATLFGGLAVALPKPEKYYRWDYGKSLKDIVELTKSDADKAIARSAAAWKAVFEPAKVSAEIAGTDGGK